MSHNKKVLAVIPARGGSKGLPGKNIRLFSGKPLIVWSIEQAKASSCVTRCVLSSEDAETLAVAREFGAETIQRPAELSLDHITNAEVVMHILNEFALNNEIFDTVLLLQPTSPLRTSHDIDAAYSLFIQRQAPSCISVCKLKQSPFIACTIEDGRLNRIIPGEIKSQRQYHPEAFTPNGAIYFVDVEWFVINKNFMIPGITVGYEMPLERSVDIDTKLDFAIAEFLMSYKT